MTGSAFIKDNRLQRESVSYSPGWFVFSAIVIYLFMSVYEIFLNVSFAAVTKYYIFALMLLLLFTYKSVKVRYYHIAILGWLIFKCLSILWVWNGMNEVIRTTMLSQIGMTAFFIVLTLVDFEHKWIVRLIEAIKYISFSQAFLSLFFYENYYLSPAGAGRNVLTLFGAQNDPNNQAAFYLVGFALALYFLLTEGKHPIFNSVIVLVNAYAIFQTGSRGGLLSAVGVALICAFLPTGKFGKWFTIVKLCLLLVVAAVILVLVINYADSDSVRRMLDQDSYSDGGGGRIEKWLNSLEIIKISPIIGMGWGSYFGYNNLYAAVHNTYLQSLCETGILGTIMFFIPVADAVINAFKRKIYIVLPIIAAGLMPSFFLDAYHKRFFWNAIIFGVLFAHSAPDDSCEDNPRPSLLKFRHKQKSKYVK